MSLVICEKRRSVLDAVGHCLVMGGPGCGKTTLALMKADKRITDGLSPGQKVLFLSFSRAAVSRIMDAVKSLKQDGQQSSLSIQTFHSFFWQILQGYGYLLGSPKSLSIVLAHDEKAMRDGIELDSPGWAKWELSRLQMFHDQGRVCFDLFAPLTAEIIGRAKTIRDRVAKRYPLILVDEAQDTNNEQWECVKLLATRSQVICLADPDQMIYDFLPGVGPARIAQIKASLNPHVFDFGTENNRSQGTEIASFARDILQNKVKGSGYKGVSRQIFNPCAKYRDEAIRKSIGIINSKIKKETGNPPKSIAIIASYGSGVAIITSALQKGKPIPHQVLFDEAFTLLSSRVAAFLLEPKDASKNSEDLATLLELVGSAFRAKGKTTALTKWNRCAEYAKKCRQGKTPKFKIVSAAASLIEAAHSHTLTGDPGRDWVLVKQEMGSVEEDSFSEIASSLDYLVAFARGRRIREDLAEIWMQNASYSGAREALNSALAQDQLLSGSEELKGIHVMNMHKCKGKQFDGVVLYRQQHHSPFVWRDEAALQPRSRRLLHMAITRARSHLLILEEACPECPILSKHFL